MSDGPHRENDREPMKITLEEDPVPEAAAVTEYQPAAEMTLYRYKVVMRDGTQTEGSTLARSEEQLREYFRQQGYTVTAIFPVPAQELRKPEPVVESLPEPPPVLSPQSSVLSSPSPGIEAALVAMKANREAREAAQAMGAPELEMQTLMDTTEPPEVPGYGRPCRMTPAMHQILRIWSKLPAWWPDESCLCLCFLRPRRAWLLLSAFDVRTLAWPDDTAADLWRNEVMGLALVLTEQPPELGEALRTYVRGLIDRFFVSPGEKTPGTPTSPDKPAPERREAGPDGGSGPCTA
jgi:hypothetical protein